MKMEELDLRTMKVRKKTYYPDHGQNVSQRFCEIVEMHHSKGRRLGKNPLHVEQYSPGIKVRVDDLTREMPRWNWMKPGVGLEEMVNDVSSNAIDEYIIAKRFLEGEIALRAKIWQRENGREVHFLTNKPARYVITVKMGAGDSIRLDSKDKSVVITV